MTPTSEILSLICTIFSTFNIVLAHINYSQVVCIINYRLDFVSFDNKNLQRQCKFAGKHDFPVQNSLMGRVQCLSLNGDQKFVVFIFCLVL